MSFSSKANFAQHCHQTECAGEPIWLHPDRAAYLPHENALLIADVHLGKEHTFGRHGLPIPAGPSQSDIRRIAQLVKHSAAEKLLILGDLVHAKPSPGESWIASLQSFMDDHSELRVEVVAGNHDKHGGQDFVDARVIWHDTPLVLTPFVLKHEPEKDTRGHTLCGHIHPCYRLYGSRRESIRCPVFWFGDNVTVLPSFGEFTGGHTVKPDKNDRLFLASSKGIVPLQDAQRSQSETHRAAT